MAESELSVIVPILNEAEAMPALLAYLRVLREQGCDIVLADGGSKDGSDAMARDAGFTVLACAKGRARQMNAGAAASTGAALLFLHADTRLPPDAVSLVQAALGTGHPVWGRFDVRIEGRPAMLPVIAWMMNRRSRLTGIATGDQALFLRRSALEAVGGFPDQPLMEDIELSKRLKRLSPPACIGAKAITSGRRWETRGVWRTILLMWRLRLAYWLGARPEDLAERYR
jgi:rSAM/selenodomain-associated transferase 2